MVVLFRGSDPEADYDLVEKGRGGESRTARGKIFSRVEHQFIKTGPKCIAGQQRFVAAAVPVGDGGGQQRSFLAEVVKLDPNSRTGAAVGRVQNMRGQISHFPIPRLPTGLE